MTEKNTVFDSHLREDEYMIWKGESSHLTNVSHPRRYIRLLGSFLQSAGYFTRKYLYYVLAAIFIPSSIGMSLYFISLGFEEDDPIVPFAIVFILITVVGVWRVVRSLIKISFFDKTLDALDDVGNPPQAMNPWTKNQYAITNQRVLLYEDGRFQETSLILMQDAVKTKPRNGQSDINLYDRRSPTGQLPTPIATLNNLSEEDAETAYDLLVKARDLSFEERIEDLGLE